MINKQHLLILAMSVAFVLAACSGNQESNDSGTPDACTQDGGCGSDENGPQVCTTIAQCPISHLCIGGYCQIGTVCSKAGSDQCPAGYTCNVMQEVCVPESVCASDDDCESPLPHCLLPDGVCVECTSADHCPADNICNQTYTCEPQGPDCSSDADCTELGKPHCDTHIGKCFACVTNEHCTSPQVCETSSHTCVECYNNAHCMNPDPYCWLDTFTCVECLEDAQCGTDKHCSQGTHSCTDVVCTSDNDCINQAGTHCDTNTGDCVQCLTSDHCGALQWCRDFACQSGCETDQECEEKLGAGQRCNTDDGSCFYAECLNDSDCAGNENGSHCKLDDIPSNPSQYSCVECTDDAHCDENFYCAKGTGQYICKPKPCYQYDDPDGTCAQVYDCYVCNLNNGACEPRYDCSNEPCCQGYTCNSMSHCERNLNCSDNSDCAIDSVCNQQTGQCEYQSCCGDCQTGWFCNEQTCQCEVGECKQIMETCNPDIQNCCEGLRCGLLMQLCVST